MQEPHRDSEQGKKRDRDSQVEITSLPGQPCRSDGRESFPRGVELAKDARLGLAGERSVLAGDEVGQDGDERGVLAGRLRGLGTGRVDQANAVVREVGRLEDSCPRLAFEAGRDVSAVLFVFIRCRGRRRGW